MVYCEEKGGPKKGAIHLKISSLILVPDDQLKIIIHSGTAEVQFRAETISEKIEWINALRTA